MSKGLTNLGNTCYMNSAIQCLSHLRCLNYEYSEFTEDRRKRNGSNDYGLMVKWLHLQQEMWNDTKEGVINTQDILRKFIELCHENDIYFESFQQNDASDFIRIFLDLLHESIKRNVSIKYTGEPTNTFDKLKVKSIVKWGEYFDDSYSYIIKNFYSQLLSITSCPECDYLTTNHDPIMVVTLPTPDENINSLEACIHKFTEEENFDPGEEWTCDKCKDKVLPHSKTNFWKLGKVIIFQIKLYTKKSKINHHISFPEILDMNNYCLCKEKSVDYSYNLSGICIHSGGLHGGHYYAMCRNYKDNSWNIHNDSHVSSTTIEDIRQQTPYCFFYERT